MSYYQETLEKVVGGRRDAAVYFRVPAVLSSEPENPYDANAIVVRVNGAPVAHIRKEDNVSLRRQLNAFGVSGDAQCRAEISGGWRHDNPHAMYSVKLDVIFPLDVRLIPGAPRQREPRGKRRKPDHH